jgi:hypothetical protein
MSLVTHFSSNGWTMPLSFDILDLTEECGALHLLGPLEVRGEFEVCLNCLNKLL